MRLNQELIKIGKEILAQVRSTLTNTFPHNCITEIREHSYTDANTIEFYFDNFKIFLIIEKNVAHWSPPNLMSEDGEIHIIKNYPKSFKLHDPDYINTIVDWLKKEKNGQKS